MIGITEKLQEDILTVMESMDTLQRECKDIFDAYWKTDANTNISGLSSDSDPATVQTKFTKKNYIDGITFCDNLNKFFTNTAITQADYLQTINQVKYGNAVLATQLSVATEEIGIRVKQMCLDSLELYKQAQNISETYYDNEVGDIIAVIESYRKVFGSDMTKNDLTIAIVLLEQFVNLLTNASVTTGDYSSTVSQWRRFQESV